MLEGEQNTFKQKSNRKKRIEEQRKEFEEKINLI
jgi:hypothetical protein